MIVQSTSSVLAYSSAVARSPSTRQHLAASPANTADTIHISQAAREALATSSSSVAANTDRSVEARLAQIRANGPVNRSHEDNDFLFANDKKLAEISAKSYNTRTADDIDYLQKATGLVNTFAHLSSAEKALYDKAVSSGNTEAAAGIAQIALIRKMDGGANGMTYNSRTTEITAANIEKYFRHGIVDPSGNAESKFQALIQFLQNNSVA